MAQRTDHTFITPLNAVRFFAAIAIVIYHYGRWSYPFSQPTLQPFVLNANLGVTLFFVLSGFIMVHVYGATLAHLTKKNVVAFFRARAARIIPLYVAALILAAWSFHLQGADIPLTSFFYQLFFLQSWIPNESLLINFTGWSLSVELVFYVLFPFVYAWFRKLGQRTQFITTSLVWSVSNAITAYFVSSYYPDAERSNVLIKFFPLLHLNSFLIGMFAGIWFTRSKKQVHPGLVSLAVLLLCTFPFLAPSGMWPIFHNGLLAPAFAILITALAKAKHRLTDLISVPPLVVGGDISYGIYILQVPIYNFVYYAYKQMGIFDALREEGRFFLYLALLCVASWISLKTIEAYGKRLIRGSER